MYFHGVRAQEKMYFHGVGVKMYFVGGHRGLWGCGGSCVGWVLWAVGGFVGQAGLGVGRRPEANQACERARYACNGE